MILPKGKKFSPQELSEVKAILAEYNVNLMEINGTHRTIYAMMGDERHEIMINRLEGLDYIERVDSMLSPYKLMDLHSDLANHKTRLNNKVFGEEPVIIAGHCTIDPKNKNLYLESAHAIKEAGADALRGGVWKPRTSPYSFQGDTKAISILLQAREETGLPICTEVMDKENLEIAMDAKVDCLQVGTRNALNYSLLKEIGKKVGDKETLVLLKRSRHMAPMDEFILAAEYIAASGNPNILLCPRGTQPSVEGYRNYPDESIIPLLKQKTWVPIVADTSHSVGRAIYVPQATLAAFSYGADGAILECHVDPKKGIGDDPKQAITPATLQALIKDTKEIFSLKRKYLKYMN
jgi:3-deoxy-7-phosphoheptulonate synthase